MGEVNSRNCHTANLMSNFQKYLLTNYLENTVQISGSQSWVDKSVFCKTSWISSLDRLTGQELAKQDRPKYIFILAKNLTSCGQAEDMNDSGDEWICSWLDSSTLGMLTAWWITPYLRSRDYGRLPSIIRGFSGPKHQLMMDEDIQDVSIQISGVMDKAGTAT